MGLKKNRGQRKPENLNPFKLRGKSKQLTSPDPRRWITPVGANWTACSWSWWEIEISWVHRYGISWTIMVYRKPMNFHGKSHYEFIGRPSTPGRYGSHWLGIADLTNAYRTTGSSVISSELQAMEETWHPTFFKATPYIYIIILLHYIIVYYTIFHYTISYYIILYYSLLYCI